MSPFKAVFLREIRKIVKNRQIWITLTIVPIALCCLFLYIFRDESPKDLPISFIDNDNSKISREFARMLDSAPAVNIVSRPENELQAKSEITNGKTYAVVVIPSNFESDIKKSMQPVVSFKYNNQYLLTGGVIYKDVMATYKTLEAQLSAKKLAAAGMPSEKIKAVILPVSIDEHVKSNPYLNYAYFLVIAGFAHILQLLVAFTAIWALGVEFRDGTSDKWLETAGNSIFVAVYAKLLPYFIMYTISGIFMFVVYELAYNAPINGNLPFLAFSMLLFILSYQSMGIVFVALTTNLRLALSCGSFYTALGFTFAGVTYPVFAMPMLGQIYAQFLPIKHWLKIGIGQTLLGTPIHDQIYLCYILVVFCILPLVLFPRLKRCAQNENCWGLL